MRSIFAPLSLLLLAGCFVSSPEQTFVSKSIQIPRDDDEAALFGRDLNQDFSVDNTDNNLLGFVQIFSIFRNSSDGEIDIDLQAQLDQAIASGRLLFGIDLKAPLLRSDGLVAYLATTPQGQPAFDGSDVLIDSESFVFNEAELDRHHTLTTKPSSFLFPLAILPDELTIFRLDNAVITGVVALDADIAFNGSLSGTINALEFARHLDVFAVLAERFIQADAARYNPDVAGDPGAPIPCSADADCLAQGLGGGECTEKDGQGALSGVCVALDAPAAQAILLLDENRNGHVEVAFDEARRDFTINEMSLFFTFTDPFCGCEPRGAIGSLFALDADGDGLRESMGVGVGLSSVTALHP